MAKLHKNSNGFSPIEVLLVLVTLAIVGVGGYFVAKHIDAKKTTSPSSTAAKTSSSTATTTTPVATDPYAGWQTYTSPLKSGLSFKYPADWDFTPNTSVPAANNLGGVENDSVLRSAKIQGTYGTVTNQYMCVDIDEYSASGWSSSNWAFGKELSSEQVIVGGKSATLSTYAGDTPMQSELILHSPNIPAGNHFVATKNNFVVSVKAAFNSCQQPAGGEGITNQQADFNQQPETAVAEKIIKSILF